MRKIHKEVNLAGDIEIVDSTLYILHKIAPVASAQIFNGVLI